MSSLPLWGRVRVGAADNSSAGLEFCRVAVQVIVWKEVYCPIRLRTFRQIRNLGGNQFRRKFADFILGEIRIITIFFQNFLQGIAAFGVRENHARVCIGVAGNPYTLKIRSFIQRTVAMVW